MTTKLKINKKKLIYCSKSFHRAVFLNLLTPKEPFQYFLVSRGTPAKVKSMAALEDAIITIISNKMILTSFMKPIYHFLCILNNCTVVPVPCNFLAMLNKEPHAYKKIIRIKITFFLKIFFALCLLPLFSLGGPTSNTLPFDFYVNNLFFLHCIYGGSHGCHSKNVSFCSSPLYAIQAIVLHFASCFRVSLIQH